MKRLIPMAVLFLAGAVQAGTPARTIQWAGHIEDANGPLDREADMTFTVFDADGDIVSEVREPSVDVVNGDFIVDIEVVDEEGLTLGVSIEGTTLLPRTPLPVSWPSAALATTAQAADRADSADSVGTVTDPLTIETLATPGAVAIPVANVAGFPAPFLDGDDGLDFTVGSTLTFNNGTIGIRAASLNDTHLSSLSSDDIAASGLGTNDLADGSIGANRLSSLSLAKIANGALTSRHFSGAETSLFAVVESGCLEPLTEITLASTCTFTNTGSCVANVVNGMPVPGKFNCLGVCVGGSTSQCANELVGATVLP